MGPRTQEVVHLERAYERESVRLYISSLEAVFTVGWNPACNTVSAVRSNISETPSATDGCDLRHASHHGATRYHGVGDGMVTRLTRGILTKLAGPDSDRCPRSES